MTCRARHASCLWKPGSAGGCLSFTPPAACKSAGDTGVRSAGLESCRRAEESYQINPDCRKLLGNWCLGKNCAAGYPFSPVNQDCECTSPIQSTCLWQRDADLRQCCVWVCTHLEAVGRCTLRRLLETGRFDLFPWVLCRMQQHGSLDRSRLVTSPIHSFSDNFCCASRRRIISPPHKLLCLASLVVRKGTNSIRFCCCCWFFFPRLSCSIIKMAQAVMNN